MLLKHLHLLCFLPLLLNFQVIMNFVWKFFSKSKLCHGLNVNSLPCFPFLHSRHSSRSSKSLKYWKSHIKIYDNFFLSPGHPTKSPLASYSQDSPTYLIPWSSEVNFPLLPWPPGQHFPSAVQQRKSFYSLPRNKLGQSKDLFQSE